MKKQKIKELLEQAYIHGRNELGFIRFDEWVKEVLGNGCEEIFHDDDGSFRCGVEHKKETKLCGECDKLAKSKSCEQKEKGK